MASRLCDPSTGTLVAGGSVEVAEVPSVDVELDDGEEMAVPDPSAAHPADRTTMIAARQCRSRLTGSA